MSPLGSIFHYIYFTQNSIFNLQKNLVMLKTVKFHVKLGLTECQNMPNQIWILLVTYFSSSKLYCLLLLYTYSIILLTLNFFLKKCLDIIKEYVLPILAPEIQHKSECGIASDMFSLGMVMIAAFNGGQSVIQANHSTNLYFKQAGVVSRTCG